MIYTYTAIIIALIALLAYMGWQFINNCEEHERVMSADDLIDYDN